MSLAETFGRSTFARVMNSPSGRFARVGAGIALMAWGYLQRDTAAGIAFIAVGLLPLATGAFDLCLISAILGGPMRAAAGRKRAG